MSNNDLKGYRCAAIVGPYLSGKTTLMESLLFRAGAISRKGTVKDKNTVGDGAPESKERGMSTELSVASMEYLGDKWSLIDCPGSVELGQDARGALMVCDVAIVVCEPAPDRAITVAPVLKFLDDHSVPHVIFINKMDTPGASVRATLDALQSVSERPLLMREIPIRNADGDGVVGFVDLVSERAYEYNEHKESKLISLPESVASQEQDARNEMLEALADFDDALMEELLEDVTPSSDEVYGNLTKDLKDDLIVPVFFGSAEMENGINRLLKVMRHETPNCAATAERLLIEAPANTPVAQVFKTVQGTASGKLSMARIWAGEVAEGQTLNGERVGGVLHMMGQQQIKAATAVEGDVVAFGRMDGVATGDMLSPDGNVSSSGWPDAPKPLFSAAINAVKRDDEVKISGALTKITDEDPSISFIHDQDTGELVLQGQGEVHLKIAMSRLANRYKLKVVSSTPQVPYKESIRKSVTQHARHKKQSGGHGEFGDVHLEIKPLPRGSGFQFDDKITGGVVPKQYIPAVHNGVKEFMVRGPLGFTVVDVGVTLTDGGFHAVDSSEMAFKKAAAQAMREGMPKCSPVLLEPIFQVEISIPNEFTSKCQRLISGRRGQILGYAAKEGWPSWDVVQASMPQSEMQDLVIELRSLSLGIGSYEYTFDRLQELSGREADQVVAARAET